ALQQQRVQGLEQRRGTRQPTGAGQRRRAQIKLVRPQQATQRLLFAGAGEEEADPGKLFTWLGLSAQVRDVPALGEAIPRLERVLDAAGDHEAAIRLEQQRLPGTPFGRSARPSQGLEVKGTNERLAGTEGKPRVGR